MTADWQARVARGGASLGTSLSLGLAALSLVGGAQAQIPAAAIERIVPTAAQGSTDTLARIVADGLARRGFGDVRVRNMPGRSGTLAAAQVAGSPADGRTLLIATPSSHGIASAFEASMPHDPVASFTPIVRFAAAPYLLVVRPGGPATLAQFVELARAAQPSLRYASTGTDGPHHLVAEFYFQRAGLKLQHVPMAGGAAALVAAQAHVQAGTVRALAVTTRKRSALAPDLPTVQESGLPGYEVGGWIGLFAPAGIAPDILNRLQHAIDETLKDGEMRQALARIGIEATPSPAQALRERVESDSRRWAQLIKSRKIELQ